ncbi:hypothetical protein [Paraflavitalea speifideaquila]|uniref:hypothetical protein n=1 Tax=Paraflavitalea speifideaquila TaxID=3076558 RepID=UPI0028E938B1|nr:hypothetical protein [Paraflavitalea speifideiaquila]
MIGQFQSQDEINGYDVNIDNEGNRTLLPGDLIYKDINGDKKIDGYDVRPIGYAANKNPNVNFGFTLSASFRGSILRPISRAVPCILMDSTGK